MRREIAAPAAIDLIVDSATNVPSIPLPEITTASDLYARELKPARALLIGILWVGLTLLVARPKAGKSWLALQIAIHLAGGPPLKGVKTAQTGPVLYVALEEPPTRTQPRLRQISPSGEWSGNLQFVYDLLPLTGGGYEQLRCLLQQMKPAPIALVVDTFTAAVKTGSKAGSDVFRAQYAEVTLFRKLAEEFGIAVLLIHHTRKGASDGAIDAVAGTGGVAAAVDAVWHLRRKPEGEATLELVGRESEEQIFALRFEQEPFGWQVLGDDPLQVLNAERREILELLKEDGPLTPAQIATELGKPRPATRQMLKRMRDDRQVRKDGTKYSHTH